MLGKARFTHRSTRELWLKRGSKFMQAGQFFQASACYTEALKHFPTDPHLHYCRAVANHKNKKLVEAISNYNQAIHFNPKLVEAFENLAEAQTELLLFEDALLSIRAAIALNPERPISHTRLARILIRNGQYDEAIKVATQALILDPKNAITYLVRSDAYRGLNKLSQSIADLHQAMELDPNNPEYLYNMSFDLLLNEEFDRGWAAYEARFQTANFLKNAPQMVSPRWYGKEDIAGKSILICPEQGLGDQIQFGRYALILHGMGAKVIMPMAPALVEIMQSMHPEIFVTSSEQPASSLPHHDFHVPMMSLLGIFHTDLSSIPCADRYIAPNANIAKKWTKRFEHKSKPQIGVTWSGSQIHVNDRNRSMSLSQLSPLFDLDADWHILQTEIRPVDETELQHSPLIDWRKSLPNLHETAGLLDQLDLLITVDTSVAHLSAALGKPTWIMLPYAPDFRWLLNRNDSPWYPSVHLFRQSTPGNWEGVVKEIRNTLLKD